MPKLDPLEPIVVDARFNGGALAVATEPLLHDPASTLVTIRGGATELALFPHEARALANVLTIAADHAAAALVAERRRAPGRESQERAAPRRMESVDTNVAAPSDIDPPQERAT
jgi:hypothetical protein